MPKLITIPAADIIMNVEDNSRRFTAASVEALTLQLLDANCQLEPVGVAKIKTGENKGKYRLCYGFRRVHALKDIADGQMAPAESPLYSVQALLHENVDATDDKAMYTMNVAENAHRQEQTTMDQSIAANKMLDEFGMSNDEVAKALDISKSRLSQIKPLMKLPLVVQEAIHTGMISGTTGYELSKEKDEAKCLEAFYIMTGKPGKVTREDAKEARRKQAVEAAPEGTAPEKAATASRPMRVIFEMLSIYRVTDDKKLKGNRQKFVELLEGYRDGSVTDRTFRTNFEKYVPE